MRDASVHSMYSKLEISGVDSRNCTLGVMGAWGKSIVVVVVVAITINGVGTVS